MKKISTNANRLILFYILRVALISVISLISFTLLFSEIIYKLELSLDSSEIISIIVILISGALTSFFSLHKIKNNGALLGIISTVPLIFFSLMNMLFNENTPLGFGIKAVILIATGALFGILRVKRNNKFKV